jgi:predicted transcriptional regulator
MALDGSPDSLRVVLSIRPTYIERILAGRKTVELRRRFPTSLPSGAIALLYSTSPTQAIVGTAEVFAVEQLRLPSLWKQFSSASAVTRAEFENYFEGVKYGCALQLTNIQRFRNPIRLTELVRQFEFSPPQSYSYWKHALPRKAAYGSTQTLT